MRAIETRDSAQYRYVAGQLQRSKKLLSLRGLNANHNHELKNVFADPKYAETLKKLKEEMYRLKKELKDENQFQDKLPPAGVDGGPAKKP